jgi:hypothetical protein
MNPRVEVKTNEERRVDALAYYYRNRKKILLKEKIARENKKEK